MPEGQKFDIERLIEHLEKTNQNIVINFIEIDNVTITQNTDQSTNQNVSTGVMIGSSVSKDTTSSTTAAPASHGWMGKVLEKAGKATPLVVVAALALSLYYGGVDTKLTTCLSQLTKIVMKE